jgi:hypothetical protein
VSETVAGGAIVARLAEPEPGRGVYAHPGQFAVQVPARTIEKPLSAAPVLRQMTLRIASPIRGVLQVVGLLDVGLADPGHMVAISLHEITVDLLPSNKDVGPCDLMALTVL